jgi:TM2 domain-containing membrane protein YozV
LTYCKHCGDELPSDGVDNCPFCGGELDYNAPKPPVAEKERKQVKVIKLVPHKSPGTAALIAFIGAIFGLLGIGQIYVGRIGRGLAILLSGFVLYALIWITFFGTFLGGALAGARNSLGLMHIGGSVAVAFIFMYVGLWIWQILDARSAAKKYNEEQAILAAVEPE